MSDLLTKLSKYCRDNKLNYHMGKVHGVAVIEFPNDVDKKSMDEFIEEQNDNGEEIVVTSWVGSTLSLEVY